MKFDVITVVAGKPHVLATTRSERAAREAAQKASLTNPGTAFHVVRQIGQQLVATYKEEPQR
jgi:hypothetical protein